MTLITCLHHLLLHSRSHEQSISAFIIAISCQSLCSYVRVAKGYLFLHCQAGAVRSHDQCHVLLTQHNQENARMSPDPSFEGCGLGTRLMAHVMQLIIVHNLLWTNTAASTAQTTTSRVWHMSKQEKMASNTCKIAVVVGRRFYYK